MIESSTSSLLNMESMAIAAGVGAPEYYVWEVPGKPIVVHLDFDVVDRLLQEVMRGFGVVPRRGVEMGGLLLGSVNRSGSQYIVHVQDFEPIPCRHTKGPTYMLSEEEETRFAEIVRLWDMSTGKAIHALGFYRSHTREGLGLSEQDLGIYNNHFPEAYSIALLVKPYATRVSLGAIFFRENGEVRSGSSYQEFPFRRRELGGESTSDTGATAAAVPRPAPPAEPRATTSPVASSAAVSDPMPTDQLTFGLPVAKKDEKTGKRYKSGWVWIPLSFIFLLLGVVLGFQVALSVRAQMPPGMKNDPYGMGLSVTPSGDSVHVKWDRNAIPILSSSKGALVIVDGGHLKTVNLDAAQLQNGSVIYRRGSNTVQFRLEVFVRDRAVVAETIDFKVQESK